MMEAEKKSVARRLLEIPVSLLAIAGAVLWWLSQPPFGFSELAWLAAIPWLLFATRKSISVRDYSVFFAVAVIYWTVTMQGIRFAHPAMYAALMAFALYLASYSLAFVLLIKRAQHWSSNRMPIWMAVPMIGTGLECIRNYLLTGISAVMIGHTQANRPLIVQIADAFGSYGITFLVLLVNASIFCAVISPGQSKAKRFSPLCIAGVLLLLTLGYGQWRMSQINALPSPEVHHFNVALIGRNEEIVFEQDSRCELEIFDAYLRQSISAAEEAATRGDTLDVVVWPESMYTGSLPWVLKERDAKSPHALNAERGETEIAAIIDENRQQFQRRAAQVQSVLKQFSHQSNDPHLIVGCTVIRYDDTPKVFSSVVHVGARGEVLDWYGKTHLVMFGEYIPLIEYLPWLNHFVPPGMGIERGLEPVPMRVGQMTLSPNVCIETAVERVTPQQVKILINRGMAPDAIVNVTNDGWFDRTSIVEHHLRCSQLVAVTCRRPVLMAANGGPTAWIESSGRIVKRLANEEAGAIIAHPKTDGRWGLYQSIGDWPARGLGLFCLALMIPKRISFRRSSVIP